MKHINTENICEIRFTIQEFKILKNALNEVYETKAISNGEFKTRLGVEREKVREFSNSLLQLEMAAKEKGEIDVNFSLDDVRILNNALNEICNGIGLLNFETKIGAKREEAEILLEYIHESMNKMTPSMPSKENFVINNKKCTLEADGYRVTFYMQDLIFPKGIAKRGNIAVWVILAIDTENVEINVKALPSQMPIEYLQSAILRLAQYIDLLEEASHTETHIFRERNEIFELYALAAEETENSEKYVIIYFTVNVSYRKSRGIKNPGVGARSAVTLKNFRSFTSGMKEILDELSESDNCTEN